MQKNVLTRGLEISKLGLQARKLRQTEEEQIKIAAREYLVSSMGKLKGLPQKMGQIFSMSEKLLTDNEFVALNTQGEPLALDIVLQILQKTWHRPLDQILREISPQGIPASLGQVHRAVLCDGREVAIKVRYPDIAQAIEADMKLLGWLSLPFGGMKGFAMSDFQEMMQDNLRRELDYLEEARAQRFFYQMSKSPEFTHFSSPHTNALVVPQVLDEWSFENVLVSTWESGENIVLVSQNWTVDERQAMQELVIKIFMYTLFEKGFYHADPHPGNYAFRRKNGKLELVLYDYGCFAELDPSERLALLKLFESALNKGSSSPYPWYLQLGFNPKLLEPMAHKLAAFTETLLEPFLSEYRYKFEFWHRGERVNNILGEDRWNIRIAAPPKLLLMMRAFAGLFYYLKQLEDSAWLRPKLEQLLAQHAQQLKTLIPPPLPKEYTYDNMAKYLKILVRENGQTKISMTMTRNAVDDLETLIPSNTLIKIKELGINLHEVVERTMANQYRPGELFTLTISELKKEIRVWLE